MFERKNVLLLPAIKNIEEIAKTLSLPVKLTKGSYQDLEFKFRDHTICLSYKGINIKEFDFVWLLSNWNSRDLACAVQMYLDNYKIPHTKVEPATSKITDQMVFMLEDIPTPNTFYVHSAEIEEHVEALEKTCKYPIIIKDVTGCRGKLSAIVQNRTELIETFAQLPTHKKFLFQQFIPNEYDWGILVANGKIVSAEKSYPALGEFRNNAANGSTEIFVAINDIPSDVRDIALQASSALGLNWSRADIVVDRESNQAYLMEVNRYPGITSGSSEVAGARDFLNSELNSIIEAPSLQSYEVINEGASTFD